MIHFNSSLNTPVNVSVQGVKQEVVQKNIQDNQVESKGLPSLPLGYNGIVITENKDVIIQMPPVDLKSYQEIGQNAVKDIISRAGKKGQVLDWIGVLPENQLKNIDSIYKLAEEAKNGGYTDLVVLGIGGSRNPNESIVKMLGKDSKIHFYSGIDPQSFKNFTDKLDLNKTKFLVVSKSGGTLETTVAYENSKKLMQDYLKKDDVSDRFIAMTNAVSEKSKLRQIVDKGEIKYSGLVHDDISGGYSAFDDATIFTLAYAGVDKKDVEKMLKASAVAQKEFLNPDINKNQALKLAAFDVDSRLKGKNKHFVDYFGDNFAGAVLWEKQIKNEGLKSNLFTDTNIGPACLHYKTEADLDSGNKDSFYTFIYAKPQDKTTAALINGAVKAYSEQHPTSIIEIKDFSPESIAKLIELKHFETLYSGNMLRQKNGDVTPQDKPLPEVVQGNVEKYKKEVRKNLENN